MKTIKSISMIIVLYLCEWAVIYLFNAYYYWDFYNPLEWLIKMPRYSGSERFLILAAFCGSLLVNGWLYLFIADKEFRNDWLKDVEEKLED